MALAYRLKPDIFTPHFLKHLPRELLDLMPMSAMRRREENGPAPTFETCIWIDVHVDGVEFFENSREKSVSFVTPFHELHVIEESYMSKYYKFHISKCRVKFCRSGSLVLVPRTVCCLASQSLQGGPSHALWLFTMAGKGHRCMLTCGHF